MRSMTSDEMAAICGGTTINGRASATRFYTDSRSIQSGDCFVAIRGERFDGHHFLSQAAGAGAALALVDSCGDATEYPPTLPLVEVKNTLTALQQLACHVRGEWKIPVVGVVGSNGKTSTKELVAAALGSVFQTAKTHGNLNNHIGVPLTLLAVESGHEAAVVEMGTNHPGEIAALGRIVRPTVAVVTNIGAEHLEFFVDEAGVAYEEGSVLEFLDEGGVAVLNADDMWTKKLRTRTCGRVIEVGHAPHADVRIERWEATPEGQRWEAVCGGERQIFEVPLVGMHMASNAALAVGAGLALGISMAEMARGLAGVALPGGRMRVLRRNGITVIDDSYNANPSSMEAALRHLASMPGRRLAVLGTMGELGDDVANWHMRMGRVARECGADKILVVGSHVADYLRGAGVGAGAMAFSDTDEVSSFLQENMREGDVVLLKASRSARFENILKNLNWEEAACGH